MAFRLGIVSPTNALTLLTLAMFALALPILSAQGVRAAESDVRGPPGGLSPAGVRAESLNSGSVTAGPSAPARRISGALTMNPIPVPSNAFAIAGEAIAFEARGGRGQAQEVSVPLDALKALVGGFNEVSIYAYGADGKTTVTRAKLDTDNHIRFTARSGQRYLIYADIGMRYRHTYDLLCGISRIAIRPELVPRICTQILCSANAQAATDLGRSLSAIAGPASAMGDTPVGGFGGIPGGPPTGTLCDQCLGQGGEIFYPVDNCSGLVPIDPVASLRAEPVVYTFQPFPFDAPSGDPQIYRLEPNGATVNLSNNSFSDFSPDVRHDGGKIVFVSIRPGPDRLYSMDLDGTGVATIPNSHGADFPKWGRGPEFFIVFTSPAFSANSAIYRIRQDGTDRTQITFPAIGEADEMADVLNGKHIVFVRVDSAQNWNRDLYLQYIWDNRAPVRLTNTPNQSETLPVVSHNGQLLAYRVFIPGQDDQIHVARINDTSGLTLLHTIDLALPADVNIAGIDFSKDDSRLYLSTQANDVAGNLINRKHELFSVRLNGSDQRRLTTNSDADTYPSAVP